MKRSTMKNCVWGIAAVMLAALCSACDRSGEAMNEMPLPEHPRPDFEREGFVNLNGLWSFTFDAALADGDISLYDRTINVPFPWGSELSGVRETETTACYGRRISVPESWQGKRVFLVVGACDWEASVKIDDVLVGTHQGGYVPFECEITDQVDYEHGNVLKIGVEDAYSDYRLNGKQRWYDDVHGIWQTVYLEARGEKYISSLHFSPDIDQEMVHVDVRLSDAAEGEEFVLTFRNHEYEDVRVEATGTCFSVDVPMPAQHLWELDDPYLYEVTARLEGPRGTVDAVNSYFGQRKIGTATVPGQDYKYIALNNKPIYLKLCLDQSFTPDGYYTFRSDEMMRNEILISKRFGLNGNRVHIKTEVPRKLYWADKLGLLVMADVPCFWGEPLPEAREDWERCMRAQVERDYNHPSVFAWVDFNETWGLFTKIDGKDVYTTETQEWVREMYRLNKQLDPTRLVEDNSACNYDHVETDIDSWHSYRPNYKWEETLADFDKGAFTGSTHNYIGGNRKGDEPIINSECGNVWGYTYSAGEGDYTWDYHEMMNAFHRHLKIGGWLYTEHHDVKDEFNGYVKYDRTDKVDGLADIVPEMSVKDWHSDYYITPDAHFMQVVKAGSSQPLSLYAAFTTDADPGEMTLETALYGLNDRAERKELGSWQTPVGFSAFAKTLVETRSVELPDENGVYILSYVLKTKQGEVLSRNFSVYVVKDAAASTAGTAITFAPGAYTKQEWSDKQADVMGGLKVNGFGYGYFEYEVNVPETCDVDHKDAELVFEASAKQLVLKDTVGAVVREEYLKDANFAHCVSPNSYPMSDLVMWPSLVEVSVNGTECGSAALADDPADHRGILSWVAQPHTDLMYEAGSYGYLVKVRIAAGTLKTGLNTVRLSVPESACQGHGGGLAVYGKDFGRYPLDPTIVF